MIFLTTFSFLLQDLYIYITDNLQNKCVTVDSLCYWKGYQLSFGGVRSSVWNLDCTGIGAPNPHVVRGLPADESPAQPFTLFATSFCNIFLLDFPAFQPMLMIQHISGGQKLSQMLGSFFEIPFYLRSSIPASLDSTEFQFLSFQSRETDTDSKMRFAFGPCAACW